MSAATTMGYKRVTALLIKIGRTDLFEREIRTAEIRRALEHLLPTLDRASADYAAVYKACSLSARAYDQWLRRSRDWLRETLAAAEAAKEKSATP